MLDAEPLQKSNEAAEEEILSSNKSSSLNLEDYHDIVDSREIKVTE